MKATGLLIGSFCQTGTGGTPLRTEMERYYGGKIPWIKSGELKENVITSSDEHLTETALRETNVKVVPAGAILVAMYGATVGRIARLGIPATTNQAVCHIIPDEKVADTQYLYHCLRSKMPEFLARRVGGAQPNISQGIIRETLVPLPPLAEQRRIAAILDTADALREKRRQIIAKYDTLLRAVFLEMFGDPVKNPKGWPVLKLSERIIRGPQNGLYKPSSEYGEGTPILRIDSFYDGEVKKIEKLKRVRLGEDEKTLYGLAENDIVINRVNSLNYLGKSAIVPKLDEPTVFESNMMRMSFDTSRVHPLFIIKYLQSNYIKSQILKRAKDAVNQSSINQNDVKNFLFFEPPLELQTAFADLTLKVCVIQKKSIHSLEKIELLFNSLQHRAFTGKLFAEKAAAAHHEFSAD